MTLIINTVQVLVMQADGTFKKCLRRIEKYERPEGALIGVPVPELYQGEILHYDLVQGMYLIVPSPF